MKINILSGALSLLACLLSISLIDKLGRRPLLLIGSLGMTVTQGILAWAFAQATMVGGHVNLATASARPPCSRQTSMWCSST